MKEHPLEEKEMENGVYGPSPPFVIDLKRQAQNTPTTNADDSMKSSNSADATQKTDSQLLDSLLLGYFSIPCIIAADSIYKKLVLHYKNPREKPKKVDGDPLIPPKNSGFDLGSIILLGFGVLGTIASIRATKKLTG